MVSSKLPRKQRKQLYTTPMHKYKFIFSCGLSKELSTKYSRRSVPLRTGDKVKVMTGSFSKREAKVMSVDRSRKVVILEGIERQKVNGTKVAAPIHPSNLMIIELDLSDKRRKLEVKK